MKQAILTKNETKRLISALAHGQKETVLSLNLGKTEEKVVLVEGFALLRGEKIALAELERTKEDTCYVVKNGTLLSIDFFSEETNLFYKLKPTHDWPTVTLSSVPMHRFRHVSPKEDTLSKIREISPLGGRVLDTCCGLGYTAITAAEEKNVEKVVVFEKDANVLRIAEHNPYSEELFLNKKIILKGEDAFEGIKKIENNYFDGVIHDPPTVSFAPQLYSPEFYKELLRVMKPGAMLYHYCPTPGKTKGKEFFPLIIKRLESAGFVNAKHRPESSGVVAQKKNKI